jgi:hypothetical protein
MRQALLSLAAGMGVLILAADLTAQTLPVPTLPEPPPVPVPEPEPAPEGPRPAPTPKAKEPAPKAKKPETTTVPSEDEGRPRPRPWEYGLAFGVVADTNTDFLVPDGAGGTATVPDGRIIRNWSSPKGALRAEAAGRWVGYPGRDLLDRYYLDAGLRGDYRSSNRTNWRGDVHYWLGYTDSTPTLVDQGVALPLGKTGNFTGELGLEQKVGARTFFRAEVRLLTTTFDDPAYIDGSSLRGTVALGGQLGPRDSAAVAYALEDVLRGWASGTYLTHYGSLQWTHTVSPRSAVLLEAGASYTPEASNVGLGRGEGFFGGVSFLRQVGRSSLMAYLRREVAPAFGLGVSRLEYRAGLRASVPLRRNWTLSVAVHHIQPATTEGAEAVYAPTSNISAALDRRLGRLFTLSGEGQYRRRGEIASEPMISAFQGGLFLSVGTPRR